MHQRSATINTRVDEEALKVHLVWLHGSISWRSSCLFGESKRQLHVVHLEMGFRAKNNGLPVRNKVEEVVWVLDVGRAVRSNLETFQQLGLLLTARL